MTMRMPPSDAVVLGAGAIGLISALRLAQAGLSVTLVERGAPGRESSWAAAGILGAQMEAHAPGPLLDLGLASRALHGPLAAELLELSAIDVEHRRCGVLELAFDEADLQHLAERGAWQRAQGLAAEALPAQEVAARGGPASALGGLWFPDDGQVENRRLCEALRIACLEKDVRFDRGEVRRVCTASGRVAAVELGGSGESARARIDTPRVVVALGSWSARLSLDDRPLFPPEAVRPMLGQMLALRPARRPFSCVVASARGHVVSRGDGSGTFAVRGYAVPRVDGRVLIGATVEDEGFELRTTEEGQRELRAAAARLCPEFAQAEVIDTWAGLRPAAERAWWLHLAGMSDLLMRLHRWAAILPCFLAR